MGEDHSLGQPRIGGAYDFRTRVDPPGLILPSTVDLTDAWGDTITIRPGIRDDDARRAYKEGQCLALAVELARATGWPLYLRTLPDDEDENAVPMLLHAYVQDPNGDLIDIDGLNDGEATEEEFEDEDRMIVIPAADAETALERWADTLRPQDLNLARTFVGPVLDLYDEDAEEPAPVVVMAPRTSQA